MLEVFLSIPALAEGMGLIVAVISSLGDVVHPFASVVEVKYEVVEFNIGVEYEFPV